jgi:hypothetical protein
MIKHRPAFFEAAMRTPRRRMLVTKKSSTLAAAILHDVLHSIHTLSVSFPFKP